MRQRRNPFFWLNRLLKCPSGDGLVSGPDFKPALSLAKGADQGSNSNLSQNFSARGRCKAARLQQLFQTAIVILILPTTLVVPALAQGGYHIAGKAVNSASGAVLAQVHVTIASAQDHNQKATLVTGADGAFAFTGLPAGKFSLSAARHGFIESSYNQHERYSTAIVTGGDADSEHLVFRLAPQAVLSGRVIDEAGDPVRNANVSLFQQDQSRGVTLVRQLSQTRTDDRGMYEFDELAAGNYFVSVNARAWYALRPQTSQNGDGTTTTTEVPASFDVTYPTTFYGDTTDSSDATPIPLGGGERLTADIRLSPVQALRIRIRMPEDQARGGDMPQFLRKIFDSMENVSGEIMQSGRSTPEGGNESAMRMLGSNYVELSGIPAGKYTVFVPNGSGGAPEGALADVDLTEDGQELTPSSGEPVGSLKFKVQIAGEPRLPSQVSLALQRGDKTIAVVSRVNDNGESKFVHVPPGKYTLLAASPNADYAVTHIVMGGTPSRGHTLELPAGSSIEGTVTLVTGSGRVEGFAKRAGKGVAGAMVMLVPKDIEANSEWLRRDQSDLDGSFSLINVIPGDYVVVAIDDGWDLNWSQPGIMAHYLEQGQKVSVSAGVNQLKEAAAVQPK